MTRDASEIPRVIAPPPLIYVGFFLGGLALDRVWPLPWLFAGPARFVGYGLIAAGLGLMVVCLRLFREHGTNMPTRRPTMALITSGPYRYSRNPVYIFMSLIYAGLAIAAVSPWALALLVPLLVIVRRGVIAREEAYLEAKFGDAYRAYKARVRRWL